MMPCQQRHEESVTFPNKARVLRLGGRGIYGMRVDERLCPSALRPGPVLSGTVYRPDGIV